MTNLPRPWSEVPADEQALIAHYYIAGNYRSLQQISTERNISITGLQVACAEGKWVGAKRHAQDDQLHEQRAYAHSQQVTFGATAIGLFQNAITLMQLEVAAAVHAGDINRLDAALDKLVAMTEKWEAVRGTTASVVEDPELRAARQAEVRQQGASGAIPARDIGDYRQLMGSFIRLSMEKFSAERQEMLVAKQPQITEADVQGVQPGTPQIQAAPPTVQAPLPAFPENPHANGAGQL